VHRSDTNPETGYTVSYEDMMQDARLMRKLNISNVRTSHNPNDIRWYAICNRMGITVFDETNLEAHSHEEIFTRPELEKPWRENAVFRVTNMVERDKNQPCVLGWSLGNEQFESLPNLPVVKAMYDAVKAIDPTRGVFCERMFDVPADASFEPYLDFIAPMYRGADHYVRWHDSGKDRRPFFMCEYAHAMGNSMADLQRQWKFFEAHDGLNGGQIWDWRDQAVLRELPGIPGRHFTYGVFQTGAGDFFQHYVRPQESGNRTNLKWIALQNAQGIGLLVAGEKPANGSILPWNEEQIEGVGHIPQLPESTRWILRYDAELPGIEKTANFSFNGHYTFRFSIRPLDGAQPLRR
jgi:beta-galactosidase/beta-glucuronidase